MDNISVTDSALQNAYNTLQQLKDGSEGITSKCISNLSSQIGGLDSSFGPDIQRYIETISALNEKLKYCIDENMAAVSDRLNRIPDYENQVYRPRTFG